LIDYEALVEAYRQSLTSVLRGFRPGDFTEAFLEMWVPDEDDLKSLEGIFEAALAAKVPSLELKVGARTLSRAPRESFTRMASRFGAVTTTADGDAIIVGVTLSGDGTPAVKSAATTSAMRGARKAAPGPAVLPMGERAAAYDESIRRVSSFSHEGEEELVGAVHVIAPHRSAAKLHVWVDATKVIARARHVGAVGDDRAVLEVLCGILESLPLREAADHGAARLELALRGRGGARVVPGIVSPANADPRIGACETTLRAVVLEYTRMSGAIDPHNEYVPPANGAWTAASHAQRVALAAEAVRAVARDVGLGEADVEVTDLQGEVRVIVAFASEVAVAKRPALLFELERALKARLDEGVALYMEEMADKNRIRRLVVVKPEQAVQ
jgi:hypothetical protein